MRRTGKLFCLLAACVCLVLLWQLLCVPVQGTGPFADEQTVRSNYEMLYERKLPSFQSLTLELPEERYTLISDLVYSEDGLLLGVNNVLGQPLTVQDHPGFALQENAWQVFMVAAQHLPVTARWEGLDQTACGLNPPKAKLTLRYSGEEMLTLLVGNYLSPQLGCYVAVAGETTVYLAPSDFYETVTQPLYSLHALPGASVQHAEYAVQAALVDRDTSWILTRKGREGSLAKWQMTAPFTHDANTAFVEKYVTGICALHAEGYAGTVQTPEEMRAFGLDTGKRLLAAFSDGSVLDYTVGGNTGTGQRYIRFDRSDAVYTVGTDQIRFLEDCPPNALLDPFVYLISADLVRSLKIVHQNGEHLLERKAQGEETLYFLDGQAVDPERYSEIYRCVVGMTVDDLLYAPPGGNETLTLFYTLTDGTEKAVRFFAHDLFYDAASVDGARFLVRTSQREKLLGELEKVR